MFSFLLVRYLGVELLGYKIILCLKFKKLLNYFSKSLHSLHFNQQYEISRFSVYSPILIVCLFFFNQSHSCEYEEISHYSFFLNYLFIYFWHWVFVAARGLSLVAASGGYSSFQCMGFSLQWLLLLRSTGSRHTGFSSCGMRLSSCGSWALERKLSSCGIQAQLLRGMWDLPGPRLEPVSPALAGRFLTTAPPGKSSLQF